MEFQARTNFGSIYNAYSKQATASLYYFTSDNAFPKNIEGIIPI